MNIFCTNKNNAIIVLGRALPAITGAVFSVLLNNAVGGTIQYQYDALYRLTAATYMDSSAIAYGYDSVGNWTTNKTTVLPDTDSDGIPDWWMNQYFGHPSGQAGDKSRANDDADGDRMTNLQEFLAGTNPKDAANVLKIAFGSITNGDVHLRFGTVTNRTYRIEWTSAFSGSTNAANVWYALPDVIVGDGAVQQVTDIGAVAGSQRFYRIRLVY